jgi:signal transduction histidine kinase
MIDFYLLNYLHASSVSLPFSIQTLVSDVYARMAGLVRPGVTFRVFYSPKLPALIVSDPNLLEHIIINLLSNSFRFTHRGSVEVTIGFSAIPPSFLTLAPGIALPPPSLIIY